MTIVNGEPDTSFSCEIGDDLRIFGSPSAIARVSELFGRRDRAIDRNLHRNTRTEAQTQDIGIAFLTVGRSKKDEPLDVTGNTDAMMRMQQILIADGRRRAAARFAGIGASDIAARLRARSIDPNWVRNLARTPQAA